MTQGYWRGTVFYGEVMHASGEVAAALLIAALSLTPLRVILPRVAWLLWLMQRRRYLGVAAFGYALLHAWVYAQRLGAVDAIWTQAAAPDMWTGWLALAIMLPLALTSNNLSVRKLGRSWKRLHRLVYAAALLTLAHWFLAAFDPTMGLIYFGLLGCIRLLGRWRGRRTRRRQLA